MSFYMDIILDYTFAHIRFNQRHGELQTNKNFA